MFEAPKEHIPPITPSIELTASGQRVKLGAIDKEHGSRLAATYAYLIRLADSLPREESINE